MITKPATIPHSNRDKYICFLEIRFNITFPSKLGDFLWPGLKLKFSLHFIYILCTHLLSYPPWSGVSNMMCLWSFSMQFSAASCFILSLWSRYSPLHSDFSHSMCFYHMAMDQFHIRPRHLKSHYFIQTQLQNYNNWCKLLQFDRWYMHGKSEKCYNGMQKFVRIGEFVVF